jgi:multiple sugar transport system substrate-binding protein
MDNNTTPGGINRRKFLGTAAVVGAGAALAACSSSDSASDSEPSAEPTPAATTYDGPPVTLAFWNGFTGGDGPFMKKMVQDFNAANPNITIKDNTIQWGDYYGKLVTAVTSGNGPDVGIMHIDQLAGFAARNVLHSLDDLASALELTEADFSGTVWAAGLYNGQRYGIPLDVHPLGFFYNNDLLAKGGVEAPTDAASWDASIAAMQKAGVANPFWSTATWPTMLMWQALVKQFGGTVYNEDGTQALYAADFGYEAAEWLVKSVKDGVSPKNVSNDAQAQAFRQGKNALTWDGIWMMNAWAEVDGLNWGASALPQIGPNPGAWAGSHNFVVTAQGAKDENKLAAARVFIAYISENSLEWAKAGQVPARNSVRQKPEFAELKVQSALAEQLDHVLWAPAVPGIGDVTGPTYEKALNEIILGKKSVKQAIDEAASIANKMLKENAEKYGA